MSRNVREWLPGEGMDSGAVRALVTGAVGKWASKWFIRAEVAASGFTADHGKTEPTGWRVRNAVGTALSGSETVRLAGLALGAETERLVLSEADRDVLGRLGAEIAEDLAGMIEGALGLDPTKPGESGQADDFFAGDGALQFTICDQSDRSLLDVAIPSAAIVAFRKAAIPSASGRAPPLIPVTAAIEATPVRVVANLGTAVLPLGELAGLAAGDILVLDRAIEDGAQLSLRPRGRAFAHGTITSCDTEFALLLLPQQRNS